MLQRVDPGEAPARMPPEPAGAITSRRRSRGGTPSCEPLVQGACQSAKYLHLMDLGFCLQHKLDRKRTESRRNYAIHTFFGPRFYTAVELGFSWDFTGVLGRLDSRLQLSKKPGAPRFGESGSGRERAR